MLAEVAIVRSRDSAWFARAFASAAAFSATARCRVAFTATPAIASRSTSAAFLPACALAASSSANRLCSCSVILFLFPLRLDRVWVSIGLSGFDERDLAEVERDHGTVVSVLAGVLAADRATAAEIRFPVRVKPCALVGIHVVC